MASEAGHMDLDPGQKTLYSVAVVLLVLGAGMMSGLTLGLLSLDVMDLEILKASGAPKERRAASSLISLVSKPHWLLCTLLLCNAACMEALPIFLDRLLNPGAAIALSVTAILVFGEIIPQAACSRYGVAIGAWFAPVVKVLMYVCAPVTWPLSKLLDWVLGHEDSAMERKEIKAMVQLHTAEAGFGGALTPQEVAVIHGAMDLTNKTALAAMTPFDKVLMLSDSTVLDEATVREVLLSGHSRVPVYRGNNPHDVCGLVLVKEMLQFWRTETLPTVNQLELRHMPRIPADTPMFDVLRLFQTGNSHMALLLVPEGTDIEELRRTRGRLESRETDTTASAATPKAASRGTDSRDVNGAANTGDHESTDHPRGGKKKRVSWRIGSKTSSTCGSSRRSSSDSEGRSPPAVETSSAAAAAAADLGGRNAAPQVAGACATGCDGSLGCADSRGLRRTSSSSSSSGSSSSGDSDSGRSSKRRSSGLGRLLHRVTRRLPEQLSDGQPDLEKGEGSTVAPAAVAAAVASYCSTGCCVDVLRGDSNVRLVPVGIITLEDVMEELLQVEIVDETDTHIDNLQTEKVNIQHLIDSLPSHLQSLMKAEMLAAAQNFIRNSALTPVPGRSTGGIPHSLASQDSHGTGSLTAQKKTEGGKPVNSQTAWPVSAMLGRPFTAHSGTGDVTRSFTASAGGQPMPGDTLKRPVRNSDPGALQEGLDKLQSEGGVQIINNTSNRTPPAAPVVRHGSASDGGGGLDTSQTPSTAAAAAAGAGPTAVAGPSTGGVLIRNQRQTSHPLPGYLAAAAAALASPAPAGTGTRAFKSVRSSSKRDLLMSPEVSGQLPKEE